MHFFKRNNLAAELRPVLMILRFFLLILACCPAVGRHGRRLTTGNPSPSMAADLSPAGLACQIPLLISDPTFRFYSLLK
jgi:hypothetical protein